MKQLLCSMLILASFASCKSKNKDLTREQAKELIVTKFNYPGHRTLAFESQVYDASWHVILWRYKKLEEAGCITYTQYGWTIESWFTDKGKQYIAGAEQDKGQGNKVVPVKASMVEFGEITGMVAQPEKNIVQVNYTIRETPTPFGEHMFGITAGTVNKIAIVQKYDDGWRIVTSD